MPLLDWLNKAQSLKAAQAAPFRLLDEVPELSYGDAENENMLIQGDNLDGLKALLPLYAGKVKCIYIDPPYNTKSAFEHYDDNLEHSTWLSLMYPRLELLRELLSEDGSIWVSIDDNEAHYLKVVMDEVFGRQNFVANIIWQKKYAVANDHKTIAPMHDHILVYQKSGLWKRNLLPRTDEKDLQYKYSDEKGVFRSSDYTCNKSMEERPNLYYPIIQPNTGDEIWPSKTRVWAYSQEEHLRHIAEGFIYWGKDGNGKTPSYKRYKHLLRNDGVVPQTLWMHTFAGHTDGSRKEAREVLGSTSLANDFITPKPELLISRILQTATKENDLVLDSFLGSGTTAAVAHKMSRRYIGIEMGDHAQTHCALRLKKVIDGEQGGISESVNWKGGGGFRFYKLGASIFLPDGTINPDVRFKQLASFVWFSETKRPLRRVAHNPLIGTHEGTAYYLLYNGILGDRRPDGGNVLTRLVLKELPPHEGPKVIYGESALLGVDTLKKNNIIFKQIPYEVRVR